MSMSVLPQKEFQLIVFLSPMNGHTFLSLHDMISLLLLKTKDLKYYNVMILRISFPFPRACCLCLFVCSCLVTIWN